MKINVTKWGNSLGIRIPNSFAKQMCISSGSEIEINLRKNEIVILKPKITLEDLLTKITKQNVHKETDTGAFSDREIW